MSNLANAIRHNVNVQCQGRFRAIKHTGHTFDADGKVIEYGKVIEETPFGNNKITLTGFNKLLGSSAGVGGSGGWSQLVVVAGSSNAAPDESNTTLGSYQGKSQTIVSAVTTRNVVPDGSGQVWWRLTYRVTFNPTTLGTGPKNIAEAGISTGISLGSVTSSTALSARGLLVDGGGNPTTVSLDASTEYLDIIWEFTMYFPASSVGVVSLTIDGTPTNHDYEVRPNHFDNVGGSYNYKGWQDFVNSIAISCVSNLTYDKSDAETCAMSGPLVALSGASMSSQYLVGNIPPSGSFQFEAYTTNSKQRTATVTWTPNFGNVVGGVGAVRLNFSAFQWAVSFSPKIQKVNTKQLTLQFTITMANK